MNNKNSKWNCELSLDQLINDPLVAAVMTADRVDAGELYETLSEKARSFVRPRTASRIKGFFAQAECCL
ncbi:MAG TPA: hypothetical protein VNR41_11660 [Xanthobacteraceae bacterium]|jgi:hypothetical protein|nr:hypothetical protein [Xanthobacteraceae bacterium]